MTSKMAAINRIMIHNITYRLKRRNLYIWANKMAKIHVGVRRQSLYFCDIWALLDLAFDGYCSLSKSSPFFGMLKLRILFFEFLHNNTIQSIWTSGNIHESIHITYVSLYFPSTMIQQPK